MAPTTAGSSKASKTIPMRKLGSLAAGAVKSLPTMAQPNNNDWTGIYRSAPLPAGAYYYRIDLDADGQVDMEGWIYIGD